MKVRFSDTARSLLGAAAKKDRKAVEDMLLAPGRITGETVEDEAKLQDALSVVQQAHPALFAAAQAEAGRRFPDGRRAVRRRPEDGAPIVDPKTGKPVTVSPLAFVLEGAAASLKAGG